MNKKKKKEKILNEDKGIKLTVAKIYCVCLRTSNSTEIITFNRISVFANNL